jgi:hypothetical protein
MQVRVTIWQFTSQFFGVEVSAMEEGVLCVHELRRRWKPFKDRVKGNQRYEDICIRIHRACSWLQRVEDLAEGDLDEQLILQWIAFNSLYGRWNRSRRSPEPDGETIHGFLTRVMKLDEGGRVATLLDEERKTVLAIFADDFLADYFWEDGRGSGPIRHKVPGWYVERRHGMILEKLIDRIYLLRCQLVHGAATFHGKLNRTALQNCSGLLNQLIRVFILTIVDFGAEEDWGSLCYPPLGPKVTRF